MTIDTGAAPSDDSAWDDPDRAVQIEDDNPEALAGEEIDFDEAADDGESSSESEA